MGDRVQLRAGRISGGRIKLDVVQAGPGQTATRVWSLEAKGLQEGPVLAAGTQSLADLAGVEWVLKELKRNQPAPAQAEVTLLFDDNRISGNSGCNRCFAGVQAGEMPGDLVVSEIGNTRMVCPEELMSLQQHYLEALGSTRNYSLLSGKLALTWQQNSTVHAMRFAPRTPEK